MAEFDAKGFNTAPYGISLSLNPFNSSEYMMSVDHGGATLAQEYYADPNEPLPEELSEIAKIFGPDNRHASDYSYYYSNIKDNVAKRIATYKAYH